MEIKLHAPLPDIIRRYKTPDQSPKLSLTQNTIENKINLESPRQSIKSKPHELPTQVAKVNIPKKIRSLSRNKVKLEVRKIKTSSPKPKVSRSKRENLDTSSKLIPLVAANFRDREVQNTVYHLEAKRIELEKLKTNLILNPKS